MSQTSQTKTETEVEKFHALLKRFHTLMLVTGEGDSLHARPMGVAELKPSCELSFFTSKDSSKVDEIVDNGRIAIVGQDGSAFVSLNGRGTISRDRAKIDALWKEPFKVWFPKGKDDPQLALVVFRPEEGEYWDNTGVNKIKYLFEAVKAYATGTTPPVDKEQHDKAHF